MDHTYTLFVQIKKRRTLYQRTPYNSLEAASGLEPEYNGFADRCLSHLAMPPIGKNGAGERI